MFIKVYKKNDNGIMEDLQEFVSENLIRGIKEPEGGFAPARFESAGYIEDYYISEQDFRKLINGSGVQHVERVERIFGAPPQGFDPFNPFNPFGDTVTTNNVRDAGVIDVDGNYENR